MDFEVGRRDELFRYVSEKYGEDHCALVSTLHMRKAKSAIRDAARILGYEPKNGNDIAKLIPEVCYGDDGSQMKDLDIKSSIESSKELKKMADSYPDIIETAESIEGIPSSTGIHAAGILISPVSLEDRIPLIKPNKEGVLATSLTLDDAERSFLKFDMLSLAHLDFLKALEKSTGWKFDYKDDKLYEDDAVWDLIGSRNTTGIFQIGSKTYKDRMPRLKPHNLKQLASCLALVRGPAISAKTDELYMEIVEGKKEIQKIHPLYDEITKDTNGIMIYQEQTMRLAVAFGMDLVTGYRIVKAGAKKRLNELKKYRAEFIANAPSVGCDEATANKLFDLIENSSLYSFNLAHAVSYGMITYASAYYKAHYPLEYACELLTTVYSRGRDKEYKAVYDDCRRQGIHFLPADINHSKWNFTVEDKKIRVGLCAIKGFGEKAADIVMDIDRELNSLDDLIAAIDEKQAGRIFNKKIYTTAIFSGLCDTFIDCTSREELYEEYMGKRKEKEIDEEVRLGVIKFDYKELSNADFELLFYANPFITDPINNLDSVGWKNIARGSFSIPKCYIRKVRKYKARDGQMCFLELATGDGIIDGTVFASSYKKYRQSISTGNIIKVKGMKDGSYSCVVNEIIGKEAIS